MKKSKRDLLQQEEFNKSIAEMVPNDAYHTKHECFLAGIQTGINLTKHRTAQEVNEIYDLCEAIATESHTVH